MIFERYIDLQIAQDEWKKNIRIKTDIPEGDIYTISPMMTKYGALYKNISLIEDKYGNQYKVIGNYKELIKKIRNENRVKIGYK